MSEAVEVALMVRVSLSDGPAAPAQEVGEALSAALELFTFEAGDDDSVYEVDFASLRGVDAR